MNFFLNSGMTEQQATIFSNGEQSSTPALDTALLTDAVSSVLHTPCTVLLLNKENALHSSGALVENFMMQMSLINLLGKVDKCKCLCILCYVKILGTLKLRKAKLKWYLYIICNSLPITV